jgi:predicted P-loop ATPase
MMAREVVHLAAMQCETNVARDWLETNQWDGTPRYVDFLKAFGVEVNDYTLSVARYWWTGLAGRLITPGCQADSIVVLIGGQGLGKTRGLNAIAPDICGQRTAREITINELLSPDSSARVMRATIVANMDEMRSVSKKEASDVKSALSRSVESYIPKYLESRATFGRVGLIFGTGNEHEILDDSTGHRRYLMLEVKGRVDIAWLEANMEQLWAQGAAEFRSSGVAWERAAELSPDVAKAFEVEDVWHEQVAEYAQKMNNSDLSAAHILEHALGVPSERRNQAMKARVGKIMVRLGWRQVVIRTREAKSVRVWRLEEPF